MQKPFETLLSNLDKPNAAQAMRRAVILANGLSDFIAELRLIDPADLIAFVQDFQLPTISDLIASSAELSFKPGKLSFAWAADVEISCRRRPTITLNMEFQNKGVTAFFRLRFSDRLYSVEVQAILFEAPSYDMRANTKQLQEALSDAKLPCSRSGISYSCN